MKEEKQSIDFYKKAAEEAETPEARKLYERLVQWETVHLNKLEAIYEILRKEWWETQQFSPA